jgi:serine/threonine protein kinase
MLNGKYVKKEEIGEGHYSLVYRTINSVTDEEYALKVISKTIKNVIEKVKKEILIHNKFNHNNIVKFIDLFQDYEDIYIVLEYCKHTDLATIQNRDPELFTETKVKHYILQVIDGLEHIHSKGIVHGDLKLENIYVNSDDQIKIGDFGDSNKVGDMGLGGTPVYMAPEILTDRYSHKYNYTSDIWSLGVILYIMLFNSEPFLNDSKILLVEYSFPESASEFSKDLISKILQLNPESRPSLKEIRNHSFFK